MSRYKILIVEDDKISAEYLKVLLEDNGHSVIKMLNRGSEVVAATKKLKPDLILMDIILKDETTGCDAALSVREENLDTKIIYLTSHVRADMVELAARSRADAYLLKPYRDIEILATLAVVLSKKCKKIEHSEEIELANHYRYNFKLKRLSRLDQTIPLNKSKIRLIELLVKNRDNIVSSEQICYEVWGEIKSKNTLRSLMFRVKQLLDSELILNISGSGYMVSSRS